MNVPEVGRALVRVGIDGEGRRLDRRAAAVPPISQPVPARDLDSQDAVVFVIGVPSEARRVVL